MGRGGALVALNRLSRKVLLRRRYLSEEEVGVWIMEMCGAGAETPEGGMPGLFEEWGL